MSKQSEAKAGQGYSESGPTCANCAEYRSEITPHPDVVWVQEKNLRCAIGGFAIKKRGWCAQHKWAPKT